MRRSKRGRRRSGRRPSPDVHGQRTRPLGRCDSRRRDHQPQGRHAWRFCRPAPQRAFHARVGGLDPVPGHVRRSGNVDRPMDRRARLEGAAGTTRECSSTPATRATTACAICCPRRVTSSERPARISPARRRKSRDSSTVGRSRLALPSSSRRVRRWLRCTGHERWFSRGSARRPLPERKLSR